MPKYIYSILVISRLLSQVDYTTQIQPIFDNNCTSCHSDGGTYFGGLDLSSYSMVIEGGSSGNTIVPLDHSGSELFNRITLDESDNEFMPKYGTPLSQTEINLIAQWIDEGALETPVDVDCYAEDGSEGVEIWGICYSIENTAAFGWPISIPDTATSIPDKLFSLINLTTLSITYTNISEPIPPEIGSLVNLTKLNLSNNLISGEIPSTISNLINLTSLNLSSNQLSGNIPIEIFNLVSLTGGVEPGFIGTVFYPGLNLSNNLLSGSIPQQIGLLENLKSIDLSNNQLTGLLPTQLYSLDSLQSLNLSNNLLSGEISDSIGNLTQLEGVITYAHNSTTQYDALNLSNNSFTGLLPESICYLPLDWNDSYMEEHQGFDISNNQFCAPFPNCVQPFVGSQDTTNCNSVTYSIEGRWIIPVVENDPGNTMYEFLDGLRYTYYCSDENGCDSIYWNSLDTSEAIPNPNPYTFLNDTLTIDLFFGNTWEQSVTFECDGNKVSFGDSTFLSWWRVGLYTSECEEQQLGIFSDITHPETFRLHQNYPNPFNPITNISYDLLEKSFVNITIYDMLGNVVNNLVTANQSSGYKSVQWNANNNQGEPVSA